MGVVNTVTYSLSFTYLLIMNSNNLPFKCSYLFKIHVCLKLQWSRAWNKGLVKIAILTDCNPYISNVMVGGKL